MSNSNDSPLAPESVLVDNKLEVLSELPSAVSEIIEEVKEIEVPEVIAPTDEETIQKMIEQVVNAEIKPEIIETEEKPKEEIEIAPIEAQPLEESSEDPKPEQIAETIALIEKAAEETVTHLDETLPPPPEQIQEQIQSVISDTEEQKDESNISVDVSSPLAQNSLESLPSPPLSSSQSENLPPPPPATSEETTAAASSLPSPPLSDSSSPAEKSDEIISELPAPIDDEVQSEIIPEITQVLPHVNGNGIKEEDGTQQQQKDKVNNPEQTNIKNRTTHGSDLD